MRKNLHEATGKSSVEDWWRYIKHCYNTPGVLTRRSEGGAFVHDERYNTYQNLIRDFNDRLLILLTDIAEDANRKLEYAKMPVTINLHLERAAFDKKWKDHLEAMIRTSISRR